MLELRSRKLDAVLLLREMGLPEKIPVSGELFVSSHVMYELVERSSELADDRNFGFTIGRRIDPQDWSPIATAASETDTVGDLLNHFTVKALSYSSTTQKNLLPSSRTRPRNFCNSLVHESRDADSEDPN
ncbi:MAG: AraC family transcriptional regulator ligand-binding domain-containing protein [Gammaproteobacteria bacterium]|nr:AraC family transcriptional regulator ligand-binding domain-containing protein [Gammaproteobacteria bacterium]